MKNKQLKIYQIMVLSELKSISVFFVLLLLPVSVLAITFTDSNLPIVIISTDNNPSTGKPYDIIDNPKVPATMKVVYKPDDTRNYLTDKNNTAFLNYNGRIEIELRGSSSQGLPKKSYGLSTLESDNISKNNVSILGMPKENDWVLNSLAFDPSLIRDYLSYELSRNMGNYAARGVYCEVIVNGDYRGLYVFMEKLKIDNNRINITKMTSTDNSSPGITGGYITKSDKTTGGDPVAWTMPTTAGWSVDFIHESPKPTEITPQQNTYIYNQFISLKNAMNVQNASIKTGYPSIIDVPSFIDFMIINEFGSNVDGYQLSTYFHKDRNGKLRAGPIWDFNLTYGNDLFVYGFNRSFTNVWQFNDGGNDGAKFWNDLYNNPTFQCYLAKRWMELIVANQPLNFNVISNSIDRLVTLISEATVREQSRWSTIGVHASQISTLKSWMQTRTSWLNSKLNNCTACSNLTLPALVISKINYDPMSTLTISGDSLEFVEISNNSNSSVNLTGIYFRELGLTYQFPVNAVISANGKIILASNAKTFEGMYGLKPFGQFTRNLSNKSEKLVLADAFGNVIDQVEYSDSIPWPTGIGANGQFLNLINLNSDNSLPTSWTGSSLISGLEDIRFESSIKIFPNPAQETITVQGTSLVLKSFEITDMLGRNLSSICNNNSSTNTINIKNLSPNIYLIKLHFENATIVVKKFIKR